MKTLLIRVLTALGLFAVPVLLGWNTSVNAARECYPIATLKVSFRVVFPKARQTIMTGDRAQAYLSAFNTFGNPTGFNGDTLFLTTLPNGTTLFVPLTSGIGCQRIVVGPRLHKVIMAKIARSAI